MSITYDHTAGGSALFSAFAAGTVTGAGTPVAENVLCGFQPSRIVLTEQTDDITQDWWAGMASGAYFKTAAAGTRTYETSGGPTAYAGSGIAADGGVSEGFTVPAALQTATQVISWRAYR